MGSGVRFVGEMLRGEGAKVDEVPSRKTPHCPEQNHDFLKQVTQLTVSKLICPQNPLWSWATGGLAIHEIPLENPSKA